MRLRKTTTGVLAVALLAWSGGNRAVGGVIELIDRDEWFSLVGSVITVDFVGFPPGTFITDQYADLGILFTDGNDSIRFAATAFPNDSWGLDGNGDIAVSFETPQAWIGVDFPGFLIIELFSAGDLIYTSGLLGIGGVGNFGGLISNQLFDSAILVSPFGLEAEIDDLRFGVPAPGALFLFAVAALAGGRRRRQ